MAPGKQRARVLPHGVLASGDHRSQTKASSSAIFCCASTCKTERHRAPPGKLDSSRHTHKTRAQESSLPGGVDTDSITQTFDSLRLSRTSRAVRVCQQTARVSISFRHVSRTISGGYTVTPRVTSAGQERASRRIGGTGYQHMYGKNVVKPGLENWAVRLRQSLRPYCTVLQHVNVLQEDRRLTSKSRRLGYMVDAGCDLWRGRCNLAQVERHWLYRRHACRLLRVGRHRGLLLVKPQVHCSWRGRRVAGWCVKLLNMAIWRLLEVDHRYGTYRYPS